MTTYASIADYVGRTQTPTPTTLNMGSGGSHSYGALVDGDVLSGGIWDGWTVQIPDPGTYPLVLSDVAAGLQAVSTAGVGGHVSSASDYAALMHGIYRDVEGDFAFECEFAGGGTPDAYCGFGAAAWQPSEAPRGLYCGAAPWNTASFLPKWQAYWGTYGVQASGALIDWANTSAWKIQRVGNEIRYYHGSTLGSMTQRYPSGSNTKYDIVGNVCRVGLWFGGTVGVAKTRTITSAALTYLAS